MKEILISKCQHCDVEYNYREVTKGHGGISHGCCDLCMEIYYEEQSIVNLHKLIFFMI